MNSEITKVSVSSVITSSSGPSVPEIGRGRLLICALGPFTPSASVTQSTLAIQLDKQSLRNGLQSHSGVTLSVYIVSIGHWSGGWSIWIAFGIKRQPLNGETRLQGSNISPKRCNSPFTWERRFFSACLDCTNAWNSWPTVLFLIVSSGGRFELCGRSSSIWTDSHFPPCVKMNAVVLTHDGTSISQIRYKVWTLKVYSHVTKFCSSPIFPPMTHSIIRYRILVKIGFSLTQNNKRPEISLVWTLLFFCNVTKKNRCEYRCIFRRLWAVHRTGDRSNYRPHKGSWWDSSLTFLMLPNTKVYLESNKASSSNTGQLYQKYYMSIEVQILVLIFLRLFVFIPKYMTCTGNKISITVAIITLQDQEPFRGIPAWLAEVLSKLILNRNIPLLLYLTSK